MPKTTPDDQSGEPSPKALVIDLADSPNSSPPAWPAVTEPCPTSDRPKHSDIRSLDSTEEYVSINLVLASPPGSPTKVDRDDYSSREAKRVRLTPSSTTPHCSPRYTHGVVRMNHMPGYPTAHTLRFSDIVEPHGLQKAVFTSFVVDEDWLRNQLPRRSPPMSVCLVKNWSAKHGEQPGLHSDRATNTLVVHPPMSTSGLGCFHAKLMLLYYPGFLRVAVCSGNLIAYDWEVMENTIFCQDFAVRSPPTTGAAFSAPTPVAAKGSAQPSAELYPHVSEFGAQLDRFLRDCCVPAKVRATLMDYDFQLAKAQLVMSVPGTYPKTRWDSYGQTRLAALIAEQYPKTSVDQESQPTETLPPYRDPKQIHFECQASSIGNIGGNWLPKFFKSLCGQVSETGHESKASKDLTQDTVENSTYGLRGGGSLFLSEYSYKGLGQFQACLADCLSHRPGKLTHTKLIWARTAPRLPTGYSPTFQGKGTTANDRSPPPGWFYAGSHNLSPAAWGTYCQSRTPPGTTGGRVDATQLRINNYELGVVHFAGDFGIQATPINSALNWPVLTPPYEPPPLYNNVFDPWMATRFH
ncbi:tyrosyl-DNA phosphodiesterase-domain-containing protein [Dimargaris cristalligena]|uniref:Tyrosyl-DNA phosphodiesterase-domain-containing protein n=1 Tax=Dimargaris cristalligena TaxID=215637 RepID=A0A4P9ZQX5_9FUNG|nr:tyrosyl-DNA phosphodiesterase-domain-containing protein [Dimargaris cristalligena]|eukprot:RKP35823.1 tyrosyl-DNA phosphodiesterase-domain-containing protein [Dimargaris cristalligena]